VLTMRCASMLVALASTTHSLLLVAARPCAATATAAAAPTPAGVLQDVASFGPPLGLAVPSAPLHFKRALSEYEDRLIQLQYMWFLLICVPISVGYCCCRKAAQTAPAPAQVTEVRIVPNVAMAVTTLTSFREDGPSGGA
jgi:hypothetical protein